MSKLPTGRIPEFRVEFDGVDYRAEIAVVERFHIGTEDHGIWTAEVTLAANPDGAGWVQGLPGIGLDEYDEGHKERRAHPGAADYLQRLIAAIGSPEEANGRRVVVFRKVDGHYIEGFAPLNVGGDYREPFWNRFEGKYAPEAIADAATDLATLRGLLEGGDVEPWLRVRRALAFLDGMHIA